MPVDRQVTHFVDHTGDKDTLQPFGYEDAPAAKKSKKSKKEGAATQQEPAVPATPAGRIIVIGAGPAGLAAATVLKVGSGHVSCMTVTPVPCNLQIQQPCCTSS